MPVNPSPLRSLSALCIVAVLTILLTGCYTSFPTAKGDRLLPDARILIAQGGVQSGTYSSNDITVDYRYRRTASGTLEISGKVTFSNAMQENYTTIDYFHLGIYLADSSGIILGMRDLAGAGGINFTGAGATDVTFSKTLQIPTASAMIAFRYTGRAVSDMRGSPTDFFADPILR